MKKVIGIIDYGVGNLKSIENAFKFIGANVKISSEEEVIKNADAVVLPGVGAFAAGIKNLKELGLDKVVYDLIERNKPFLGICLGMQLLFEYSEEGGRVKGLGILKGKIQRIPGGNGLKIPHMGWNNLNIVKDNLLFAGLSANPYVYFVHSYYLEAEGRNDVIAITNYGVNIGAAVNKGNLFATQFHPEKSGKFGLSILQSFVKNIVINK